MSVWKLLHIFFLRLRYRFFPGAAQKFWAQSLLNGQGVSAKLGQVLAQGKQSELPKASLSPQEAERLFRGAFQKEVVIHGPAAAASMGQVFRVTIDGHDRALKILHPGLKAKLEREIRNVLTLGRYYARARSFAFDAAVFGDFLRGMFRAETDLLREAQFQCEFAHAFRDDRRFLVPAVVGEFTTEDVLCQSYVTCTLARDVRGFAHFDVFHFFFKALLNHGLLHGDLNDRNWGVTDRGQVVVYDYGCSQLVPRVKVNAFKKLLRGEDVARAFKELGVRLGGTPFEGREVELARALFAPFHERVLPSDWSYSRELTEALGADVKVLRGVTEPWVLLALRSLFSLVRVYHDRGVAVPLRELVAPYVALLTEDGRELKLQVEVREASAPPFFMSFPVNAIGNMELYVPRHVQAHLAHTGRGLDRIIHEALARGHVAQDLIDVTLAERRYRVWIGE